MKPKMCKGTATFKGCGTKEIIENGKSNFYPSVSYLCIKCWKIYHDLHRGTKVGTVKRPYKIKQDGKQHVYYPEVECRKYYRYMTNPASEMNYINPTMEKLKKEGHGDIALLYGTMQYSALSGKEGDNDNKFVQIEGHFAEELADMYGEITQIIVGNCVSKSIEIGKAKSKASEWKTHKMISKSVQERAIDTENFEEILKEWQILYKGQKVDVFFMMSGETKGFDDIFNKIHPEGIRIFVMVKNGSYAMKLEVWQ